MNRRIYIGSISSLGTPGTLAPLGGTTGTYGQPHRGSGVALSRRQWRNRRALEGGDYEGDEGEDPMEDEEGEEDEQDDRDPGVLAVHLGALQDIAVTGLQEGFLTEGVAFRALDHIAQTDAVAAADELLGGVEDLLRRRVLAGDHVGDMSGVIPLMFMAVAKPIAKVIKGVANDPNAVPRTVESSRRLAQNVGNRATTLLDAFRDIPDAWERGGRDEPEDDADLPTQPIIIDDGTDNRQVERPRMPTQGSKPLQKLGNAARSALDLLSPVAGHVGSLGADGVGDAGATVGNVGVGNVGEITPDDPQAAIRAWRSRRGPVRPQDPWVAIDTDGATKQLE